MKGFRVEISGLGRQGEKDAVPGVLILKVQGGPDRPRVGRPIDQPQLPGFRLMAHPELTFGGVGVFRMPIHPHEGGRETEMLIEPEPRAAAELDGKGLILVFVPLQPL